MKPPATLLTVSLSVALFLSIMPSVADEDRQIVVRARRMLALHNFDGAEKYLKSALRDNPKHEQAWIMLGEIYRKQCTPAIVFGEDTGSDSCKIKAKNCFNKALELNPRCAKAFSGLGELNTMDDKFDKAIEFANKAIAADPKDFRAYKVRGMANAGLGKYKGASRDLGIYIDKDDPDFRTILTKGQIDEKLGDYKSAYTTYKKLLVKLETKRILLVEKDEIWLQIANCAAKTGRIKESFNILADVLKKKPNNYNAHLQRARLYRDRKQKELAIKDYKKALSIRYSKSIMLEMNALKK